MVYVGLDLDNTIGDFASLFPFFGYTPPSLSSTDLNPDILNIQKGTRAYNKIVKILADKEISNEPFGIFNPDMIKKLIIMKKEKDAGKIKGIVIYSNNASKEIIQFVADMLDFIVGSKSGAPFIDDFAHRYDQRRIRLDKKGDELFIKTVDFLKELLGNEDIADEELIFYDDQFHPDLKYTLGNRYKLVKKYPPYAVSDQDYYNRTLLIDQYLKEKLKEPTPTARKTQTRTTTRTQRTTRTVRRKRSKTKPTPRVS